MTTAPGLDLSRRATARRTARALTAAVAVAVLAVAGGLFTTVGAVGGAPAFALGGPVGVNEHFRATVNGMGGVNTPVVIAMACFGAVKPGQTGHPMANQTVAVRRTTATGPATGDTGALGTSIGAFFGPPPPGGAAATSGSFDGSVSRSISGPVIFHRYVTKPLPTGEVLPCAGAGTVTFVPLPMSPGTSQDVQVRVIYVGQP